MRQILSWIIVAGLSAAADCPRLRGWVADASHFQQAGDLPEAEQALRKALAGASEGACALPAQDQLLNRLAHLLQLQGRPREAEDIFREVLEFRVRSEGAESAGAALSMSDVATTLVEQGRWPAAEDLLRRSVRLLDAIHGADHFDTLMVRSNLGVLLLKAGQHARAEPVLRSVTAGFARIEPRPVHILASCYQNLGAAHYGQGELSEAETYARLHLELMEQLGDRSGILAATANLIAVDIQRGRYAAADSLMEKALALKGRIGDVDSAYLLAARGTIRRKQHRHTEAAADLSAAIGILEHAPSDVTAEFVRSLSELASVLQGEGCKRESSALRDWIETIDPDQSMRAINARSGPAFRISQIGFRPD